MEGAATGEKKGIMVFASHLHDAFFLSINPQLFDRALVEDFVVFGDANAKGVFMDRPKQDLLFR